MPAPDRVSDQLYGELWVSLASLLRSYTAAHGLNKTRQATVELGEERITVRRGDGWLDLERNGALVHWEREDGSAGMMELTEAGGLRTSLIGTDRIDVAQKEHEEEMDMVAEAWARELMA